jgi:putative ABC transport system permease protein
MVTVTAIVSVLAFHASVGAKAFGAGTGLDNPVTARVSQVILVLTVILGTLAVLNAIFTAWTTVLDVRRASALSRALGVTPQQLTAGLSAAQVLPALPGALLGIPLGIGLFKFANGGGLTVVPPISWLVATVLGTLVAVALLTSIPSLIDARRPAGEILQSEAV